jgi:hypothetical protein
MSPCNKEIQINNVNEQIIDLQGIRSLVKASTYWNQTFYHM